MGIGAEWCPVWAMTSGRQSPLRLGTCSVPSVECCNSGGSPAKTWVSGTKKTMFWKTQSMAFKFQTFGNLSTSSFRCFGNLFPVHAPFIFSQISMSSNWFEDGGAMDNCVNLRKKQLLALLSKGFPKPQMLFLISDVQVASAKSTFEWGPQQWVIDFIKRFSGKDCCLTPNHRLKLLGCRCHLIP